MPLKTRSTFPPGGFPFDQKKADGTIKKFDGLTYGFWDQVMRIRDYREGNKLEPTDKFAIAEELDGFTCERLGFDPRWVSSKKNAPWKEAQFSPSHLLRSAKHAVKGSQILSDWLGGGGQPVTQELAQSRADVCLKCPHNQEGHFVAKLTALIAKAIHEQRREKLRMGLRVEGEENLHTCDICSCHTPLLVWTPADVIAERTDAQSLTEYPDFCWKRKEIAAIKSTP